MCKRDEHGEQIEVIRLSLGLLGDSCAGWLKQMKRDPTVMLGQPAMDRVFANMRSFIDDAERAWRAAVKQGM